MPDFPTPKLHIPWSAFPESVYEPSEDTYLLIDALGQDYEYFSLKEACVILEVCCGNGFPITSASMTFDRSLCLAIDLNIRALTFTKKLSSSNQANVDPILSSLTHGLCSTSIDLLICNPPYVPSDSNINVKPCNQVDSEFLIDLAWKGGEDGMEFVHALLPEASRVLSPSGLFYCIVLASAWDNYITKHKLYVVLYFKKYKVIAMRKSVLETLLVIRFER